MSTQLETPVITLAVENKTTIKISGLTVANASGYQVKIATLAGGGVPENVTPVDGVVTFDKRSPRSMYYVCARAIGDDENYTNSDWTAEQSVLTGTDVDQSLAAPNIGAATESFTTLAISGLTAYKAYRFQIATSDATLDDSVPRIIGTGDGTAKMMGLAPGTTYFIRACLVDDTRCSVWSDVVSAATSEVSETIEVTSGNDSGTGTLRQAISDAADGTKILLKVASITLNTLINTSKRLFIVGGLTDRTVISSGSNNGLFTGAYLDFRHVSFTGAIGTNRVINSAARLDDCLVFNVIGTGTNGYLSNASIYRSVCRGNQAARYNLSACKIYETIIDTNTATSKSGVDGGGGTYNADVSNCTLVGNVATFGGGVHSGTLTSCTITGNSASNGGGAYGGTLTSCTITGNSASNGGGAYNSTLDNCLTTQNDSTYDIYENLNAGIVVRSSTVGTVYFGHASVCAAYNTLYKSLSATPGTAAGNLSFDGLESSYFVDAQNGDFRLKYGAPAIDAGNNQYVTTATDLAGNPRIGGTTVDVGAYEFEPYPLAVPTFEIEVLAGGQATISYTLPSLSSGICLQYADNGDFTNASEITSSSTSIALTGMSGTVYFRAKALGISGQTLDSAWTDTQSQFFDVTAPIVVVDRTPIEMTVYETVNLLAGVVVTDNSGETITPHYQVIDRDNQPVEVDGQTVDVRTSGIPVGNYVLKITAEDSAGNIGTADRGLAVLPPKLDTPTLTLRSLSGRTVVLAGLADYFAAGWKLDHNGTVSDVTPDAAGYIAIADLAENVTHTFKARALGDWVQPQPPTPPSGDHRDSDWSNTITVVIVPPQPRVGLFYQWESNVLLSHNNRVLQNLEFRAKITDTDTGDVLPYSAVSSAAFYAYRVIPNGTKTVISGFNGLEVPVSAFSDLVVADGYNFHYVPPQTAPLLLDAGQYLFEVKVSLITGNPFSILSKVIKVY